MNPGYSSTSVGGGEMDLISWEFTLYRVFSSINEAFV
jgi:hypothetical protein